MLLDPKIVEAMETVLFWADEVASHKSSGDESLKKLALARRVVEVLPKVVETVETIASNDYDLTYCVLHARETLRNLNAAMTETGT